MEPVLSLMPHTVLIDFTQRLEKECQNNILRVILLRIIVRVM